MVPDSGIKRLALQSIMKLLSYCKKNNWAGFDPYDALNSRVFAALPFFQNYLCRLIFTQAMKRSPVNLRPFFLVPQEQNPKGLALFVSALIMLQDLNLSNEEKQIALLINRLIELRSPDGRHYCWGYNFDWQGRHSLTPKFTPNIVSTTFIANAFLDAFDKYAHSKYLDIALSAGQFLISGLNISQETCGWCFSYTPLDRAKVHNANLLGSALLSRLYKVTGKQIFLDYSIQAVSYSISKQNNDGSWFYGEHNTQKWIDNFHTGYNLVALNSFCKHTGMQEYLKYVEKGYAFYKNHFFTSEFIPKYFYNLTYPIDIHCIAQSIITLTDMEIVDENSMKLLEPMLFWTLKNMQSQKGYFFYQKGRFLKNRISYIRWSQAWMLYSLAYLMKDFQDLNDSS